MPKLLRTNAGKAPWRECVTMRADERVPQELLVELGLKGLSRS